MSTERDAGPYWGNGTLPPVDSGSSKKGLAWRIRDYERRQARLAKIIEDWFFEQCYTHGEACKTKSECLAREIIERQIAWD